MDEEKDLAQVIRLYMKYKNDYFEAFPENDDKTEWLAIEIEKLYKCIQEKLASNRPITIIDNKALKELKRIKENSDSLFDFYRGLRFKEFDFDTFELKEPWVDPDKNESTSANELYFRLFFSYPRKIVDIRKEGPNPESISKLQDYMHAFREAYKDDSEMWDIDDKDFDKILYYLDKFNGVEERQSELIPIITKSNLSSAILGHFNTIMGCYQYEQYAAAIVFCRALLEKAYQQKYPEFGDIKLKVLVEKAQRSEIIITDYKKIDEINDKAGKILHKFFEPPIKEGSEVIFAQKGDTLVSMRNRLRESMKDVALRCIADTIFLIEKAFD